MLKKSKFIDMVSEINSKYHFLKEADDETEVDDELESEPEPEATVTPLSPEAEIYLVNMLRKTVNVQLNDQDILTINNLPDTNSNNAKQILNAIVSIIGTYVSLEDL